MEGEENKKEKLECIKRIECTGKLTWISLGISPFYRELQEIFMGDHPQVIIVVHNLISYNKNASLFLKLKNKQKL